MKKTRGAAATEQFWRRAPRIISRSSRLRPASNLNQKGGNVSARNDIEVDDEVGEGFVVRGGVMMRIADLSKEQWRPVKRFFIDVNRSQIYQDARIHGGDTVSSDDEPSSSRVTVEISALPGDGRMFHLSDNLPGVANEVESYPCRFCSNRIFLTSFGLERHTEKEHRKYLPEVIEEISRIHNEWKRREAFRDIAKKRREALKKTRMLTEVVRRSQGLPAVEATSCIADKLCPGSTICRICGLSFEANSNVLMNHIRAHRKNDDLRKRMLADFGPAYVARCTCHQCNLVFTSEKNLIIHKESSHIRKRKYVCKWCGGVCLSVNELNEHKKDVHGVSHNRAEKLSVAIRSNSSQKSTSVSAGRNHSTQNMPASTNGDESTSAKNITTVLNQNPCLTKCSECGLTTVKPSLLIRHMQRVHNKNSFSAEIEVKGMPNIRVSMDRGKVTWWCCNFSFEDRHRFIYHRKSCHQPFLQNNCMQNYAIQTTGQIVAAEGANDGGGGIIGEGQIVRLVNADGTQSDDLYVLVSEDNDFAEKNERALDEVQANETLLEGPQQITLTADEYMQLRQQLGENFDDSMQLILVNDVGESWQSSLNAVMEPAVVDFANSAMDSDNLNSSLLAGAHISSSEDKFYSDTQSADPEYSVANISDAMEDDASQGDLPLPQESLMSAETSSANIPIQAVSYSPSSSVSSSLDHHFQLRRNVIDGITVFPAIAVSNATQQYSNTACCPELPGIKVTAMPGASPSVIVISNKVTVASPSGSNYCLMGNSKPSGFLEKQGDISASAPDNIPSLLDLDRKDATATTTTSVVGSFSSEQHPSINVAGSNVPPFYISQDINAATAASHDTIIYNL